MRNLILLTALLAAAACVDSDESVHRTLTDRATGAEFDVEVFYPDGLRYEAAEKFAETIEVIPARIAREAGLDESDDGASGFEVVLSPLNAAAEAEAYSWHSTAEPGSGGCKIANRDCLAKLGR